MRRNLQIFNCKIVVSIKTKYFFLIVFLSTCRKITQIAVMKKCDEIWAEQFRGFPKGDVRRDDEKSRINQRKYQSVTLILTVLLFTT